MMTDHQGGAEAVATLTRMGYTYHGGELWKPPIGPRPAYVRQTRTYVELGLSLAAYDEIREKLRAAGYDHAFVQDGAVDLHGLAAVLDPDAEPRETVAIVARAPAAPQPIQAEEFERLWRSGGGAAGERPVAYAFVRFDSVKTWPPTIDVHLMPGWGFGDLGELGKQAEGFYLLYTGPRPPKCDGNHGGPRCADPECWNDDAATEVVTAALEASEVGRVLGYLAAGEAEIRAEKANVVWADTMARAADTIRALDVGGAPK